MVVDNDYNSIVNDMLLRENQLLSFFNYKRPMLFDLGKNKFYNGFKFWVSSLEHFTNILGPIHNNNDSNCWDFIIKYFTMKPDQSMTDSVIV